mmetsp:Transcript_23559/g.66094  ORF Transcript_23559/g.66094 Transcript_23559/m.66094 type:complete len:256 (+) Transcript_23559:1-768(+)
MDPTPEQEAGLQQGESGEVENWAFVFGNLGDCKAFHVSKITGQITDITPEARVSNDAKDCGGRLGPYLDGGQPDLRNFRLRFIPCRKGDLIFVCSDGVHDNFDPEHLGISPRELGADADEWGQLPWTESESIKSLYRLRMLHVLLYCPEKLPESQKGGHRVKSVMPRKFTNRVESPRKEEGAIHYYGSGTLSMGVPLSPATVTNRLLDFCETTNDKAIRWMQEHPSQKLPVDYEKFPGKMDHATCLSFFVGARPS